MSDKMITWIEQEIQDRGWTIRELARRSDLSPSTVSEILNRNTQPGLKFYLGMSKAFKVPRQWVFRLAGVLEPSIIGEDNAEHKEKLLDYFDVLDSQGRRTILSLAQTLYEQRQNYNANEE